MTGQLEADTDTDTGTAYAMKPPTYRAELTEVRRGTPMGELLRRYWHPVGLSTDAGATPKQVRALGEDLILFRDGEGRPGLVHNRCCDRGTTLYYGKVEDRGIRCCYHGWLFDTQGHCLEMPCEPEMGARMKERVRQPWYPVQELYGLVFAYMGPPEKKPALPRYAALEEFAEGEFLDTDDRSIGGGGTAVIPCNRLQHWENIVVRKQIYRQLQAMERGVDPMNVGFDPDAPPLRLRAGNWLAKQTEPA